ncbi:hypothetical protein [Fodinicola acaciae]|uniref:hypothetical protein n=1 Tax=Fodinicola acaciae TaxID=2681555 RepID=UPI0013D847A5|nr:hypothetical protein [Fodinicola acaciae]
MSRVQICERHEVVTPSRIDAVPVVEGHVELLGGCCGDCGQTVMALDVGHGVRQWHTVSSVVTRLRRYERQRVAEQLLGTSLQAGMPA